MKIAYNLKRPWKVECCSCHSEKYFVRLILGSRSPSLTHIVENASCTPKSSGQSSFSLLKQPQNRHPPIFRHSHLRACHTRHVFFVRQQRLQEMFSQSPEFGSNLATPNTWIREKKQSSVAICGSQTVSNRSEKDVHPQKWQFSSNKAVKTMVKPINPYKPLNLAIPFFGPSRSIWRKWESKRHQDPPWEGKFITIQNPKVISSLEEMRKSKEPYSSWCFYWKNIERFSQFFWLSWQGLCTSAQNFSR